MLAGMLQTLEPEYCLHRGWRCKCESTQQVVNGVAQNEERGSHQGSMAFKSEDGRDNTIIDPKSPTTW